MAHIKPFAHQPQDWPSRLLGVTEQSQLAVQQPLHYLTANACEPECTVIVVLLRFSKAVHKKKNRRNEIKQMMGNTIHIEQYIH